MKEKLKSMMFELCLTGFALLFIILLTLPYISGGINGYALLNVYEVGGFSLFMLSFFQFFHTIALLLLLNIGFLGILNKTGVVEFKKAYKDWSYTKLGKLIATIVASLSVAVLFFVIIVCSQYSMAIGVGSILNTILEILACVSIWLLEYYGIFDGTYKLKKKGNQTSLEIDDTESQEKIENSENETQKQIVNNENETQQEQ